MKFKKLLFALSLLSVSLSSFAVPVHYNFSATWQIEYNLTAGVPATSNIFGPGATFNGSFNYDSEVPLDYVDSLGARYPNALTSLVGNLDGNSYALTSALGGVYNSMDRFSLAGFSYLLLGDWQSDLFVMSWSSNAPLFSTQDLPSTLPPAGFPDANAFLALAFVNVTTAQRQQVTFNSFSVTPAITVPEPSTLALSFLGLGFLLLSARKRTLQK